MVYVRVHRSRPRLHSLNDSVAFYLVQAFDYNKYVRKSIFIDISRNSTCIHEMPSTEQ